MRRHEQLRRLRVRRGQRAASDEGLGRSSFHVTSYAVSQVGRGMVSDMAQQGSRGGWFIRAATRWSPVAKPTRTVLVTNPAGAILAPSAAHVGITAAPPLLDARQERRTERIQSNELLR